MGVSQAERRRVRHPDSKRTRLSSYLIFAVLFTAGLIVSHLTILDLPYFWDEAGQFIPQTFDLLRNGDWYATSVTPNVHPPGVMAYLATIWRITGPHIVITRLAMLLLAALGLLFAFRLAILLTGQARGIPALLVVLLLACSPLFYSQAMLVQLDMPAMVFTMLSLLLFLENRIALCVVACTVLVVVKETGIVAPGVFGLVLLTEKRWRDAFLFFVPAFVLAGWLAYLRSQTGHVFGSAEFTHFNVQFALGFLHLGLGALRRVSYLFVENLHILGTVAIVAGLWRGRFAGRNWSVTGLFALAHVVGVTVIGGATLERYLLPVIPLFYMAAVLGAEALPGLWRKVCLFGMLIGLLIGLFWNPPFWPFPYENNLAFVDFVKLHQDAADYVSLRFNGEKIVTAWPLGSALRNPDLGYVNRPIPTTELLDFSASRIRKIPREQMDVLILYSRDWDPPNNLMHHPLVRGLLRRSWGYEAPIGRFEVEGELGLKPLKRWERGGQWLEIYGRP